MVENGGADGSMSNWNPGRSLSSLEFVSSREMQALEAAGIIAVGDLLDWFPRRHEDRRRFDAFPVQVSGEPVCLRGRVVDSARKRFGGRKLGGKFGSETNSWAQRWIPGDNNTFWEAKS